jgi:hypothetical protein
MASVIVCGLLKQGNDQHSSPYEAQGMSAGPKVEMGMPQTHLDMQALSRNGLHDAQQMVDSTSLRNYQRSPRGSLFPSITFLVGSIHRKKCLVVLYTVS